MPGGITQVIGCPVIVYDTPGDNGDPPTKLNWAFVPHSFGRWKA